MAQLWPATNKCKRNWSGVSEREGNIRDNYLSPSVIGCGREGLLIAFGHVRQASGMTSRSIAPRLQCESRRFLMLWGRRKISVVYLLSRLEHSKRKVFCFLFSRVKFVLEKFILIKLKALPTPSQHKLCKVSLSSSTNIADYHENICFSSFVRGETLKQQHRRAKPSWVESSRGGNSRRPCSAVEEI